MRLPCRPLGLAVVLTVATAVAATAASPFARQQNPPAAELKDASPTPPGGGHAGEATGGPDGFGYTFFDQADGCTFQFVDISATGTSLGGGDDVTSAPVALSEAFNFYGTNFNSMLLGSNGFLTTDLADTGGDLSNDCPLPVPPSTPAGTNGMRIYPLHDDLVTTDSFVQYFANCPRAQGPAQGCTVFQWDDVTHFGGGGPFDMQTILYHTTGDIVSQIGAGEPEGGAGSTTGIQSDATSGASFTGLTYACNTGGSIIANTTAVCFGLPNGPDLVLTKSVDDPSPGIGATINFLINVQNTDGAASQTNVAVADTLPGSLTYVSDTCAGDFADGSWSVGTLGPGASASCSIRATFGACGDASNTATVSGDVSDPPGNNSDTVAVGPANQVQDPSFEAGTPSPFWGETSTNFGTPLCDTGTCGTGGGTAGPRTGNFWAWFGGAPAFEDGTVSQSVVIPSGDVASLELYLWNGASGNPGVDFIEVTVDGNQVAQVFDGNAAYTAGYAPLTVDLTAYADGAAHTIVIHAVQNTATVTNFSVDDVNIVSCANAIIGVNPVEIPTVNEIGLIALLLGLAGAGFALLRRNA